MKTVKIIIFVFGIFLASYVGGVPSDTKNLFITQTIFFAPYLVDFYPLIKMKSPLRFLSIFIWAAGISVFVANILGIAGIITIAQSKVIFDHSYAIPIPLNLEVNRYLLLAGIVYGTVFVGTLTLGYANAFDKHIIKKKKAKHASKKKEVAREELVENVSTR
ncbi:hypothetical protein HMPREF1013_00181 [Bacillus sp. 2_A_57_CT2]|nr:hypothetical protein HMPREF1013_00181 [Bacillus sp. 2_A_57_CT2]